MPDSIEKAIKEWEAQGRTEEQIYGVRNFFSGRGATFLRDFATAMQAAVAEKKPNGVLMRDTEARVRMDVRNRTIATTNDAQAAVVREWGLE